jgi:hypothetical protein
MHHLFSASKITPLIQLGSPAGLAVSDLPCVPILPFQESMRLLPVSGDGISRVFPHDVVLGGFQIPAGTTVWMYMYAIHSSSRVWAAPDQYMPVS